MSKSNMLLGLAKGKVGDLVFYRDGGEQRTRTRVIPKNPRSIAQMTQRTKIANVSALYRRFSSILRDSFTGRPSNQSGYNVFAKYAIPLAPYLTREMAGSSVVLPQRALASRGVLSTIDAAYYTDSDSEHFGVPVGASVTASSTVGEVSAALIEGNAGLENGDKLVFVRGLFMSIQDALATIDTYEVAVGAAEFVVNTADDTPLTRTQFTVSAEHLTVGNAATSPTGPIRMDAVIVSRVDADGALQVSTQWFELNATAQSLYDGYRTAQAISDAVESYKASDNSILR